MSAGLHAFCDVSVARSRVGGSIAKHQRLVLAITILASSLAFVDGSVINVALPVIGRALSADADSLQLTTAVLDSVDEAHTGAASGLNAAISRLGGLVATALLGAVLVSRGERLFTSFHVAMSIGACACGGAALSALMLLKR